MKDNPTRFGRVATGLAACLLLTGVAGCGGDDEDKKALTITGDCALAEAELPITRLVPESLLRSLVGPGTYRTEPGFAVIDGNLPAAYDGNCTLVRGGEDALRLATFNATTRDYKEAQQMLASGKVPGFEKVDDTTYVLPDGPGARGVSILPERIVVLRLLEPAEGIDAAKEVGAAMPEVVTRIQEVSGR